MVSQLKVNEIIKQSGSSITIGENGDTVSGPFTNVPSWRVGITSQSVAYNTDTKFQYDREHQDTDNAYDTSNYRFTVPSGKGGTYLIGAWVRIGTGTDVEAFYILPRVNGSNVGNNEEIRGTAFNKGYNVVNMTGTLQLSAGDYLEIYGGQGSVNSSFDFGYSNEGMFWGYRIIGA